MRITKNSFYSPKFKGLEATKLQAIYVQDEEMLGSEALQQQLDNIAKNYKIQVIPTSYRSPWVQDGVTFTLDGRVMTSEISAGRVFAMRHKLVPDSTFDRDTGFKHHIPGGNIFFVKDKDNKIVALSAKNLNGQCAIQGYEKAYNINRVISLAHADYHADLFVTPIGDNKILVANDNLMLKAIPYMIKKASDYIKDNPDDCDKEAIKEVIKNLTYLAFDFAQQIANSRLQGNDENVAKTLENEGFEVIKVPSRIYETHENIDGENVKLRHRLNYSNAITFKNDDNEVVYVTGKSNLDEEVGLYDEIIQKLGISFEKVFKDALFPHVKPENIHFILGDKKIPIHEILYDYKGGLHCMCAEVPVSQ